VLFPYCLFSFVYSTEVLCVMCNKLSQIKNADFAKTAFVNPCHLITGYICGTLPLSSQEVSSGLLSKSCKGEGPSVTLVFMSGEERDEHPAAFGQNKRTGQ
jgi:hypothetical protein